MMDRRKFLGAASITSIAAFTAATGGIAAMAKTDVSSIPDYDKWQLSEKEWKERLSPEAYNVLRKEGTERPWTSQFNDETREGVFACAGCGFDLFISDKKFDSGTGWPSFFDFIPGALATKRDFKRALRRSSGPRLQ